MKILDLVVTTVFRGAPHAILMLSIGYAKYGQENGPFGPVAVELEARAINAMHAEPSRAWSLGQLASTAAMSRARFAAKFRETVGTTPMAYLTEWRVGVAQSLLRRGKPVQAVADQVGYANASALSRAFATHTPPGYRPRWRTQDTAR